MTCKKFRLVWTLWLTTASLAETVQFREPNPRTYEFDAPSPAARSAVAQGDVWLTARPVSGGRPVEFGRRVIARFRSAEQADEFVVRSGLVTSWITDRRTAVLEAGSPLAAVRLAAELGRHPDVEFAVPAARRGARRHFAYAAKPNDTYYARQTYLDPAEPVSGPLPNAADLNGRGAWPLALGLNVIVGIADDGMDLTHPDLTANATGPHHNFFTGASSGSHPRTTFYHGTAVAGLIGARGGNAVGISGVAPQARLAAWIIFDANDNMPDDAGLASVFGFANDSVAVQNHSWGNADFFPLEMPVVQALAISNAVTLGRGGKGVVVVRSAGNTRIEDYDFRDGVGDANLDAYANDIHQLTVSAVRSDGRVASYSAPGACVLVATPGGETTGNFEGLFTTDPVGTRGDNRFVDPVEPQLADYLVGATAFTGTSASAPLIAGVAALVLSANPELGWRDVQQVIALSARHLDLTDPDLATNGAGLRISHNVGFGVADAGAAVRLAKVWKNRPPAVERRYLDMTSTPIPDDGFRVVVSGEGIPENLRSIPATGGTGRYPDEPTPELPLEDVGRALSSITVPLAGKGALMLRRPNTFAAKLNFAADAGAAFGIIANDVGTTERELMFDTDFTRIPAAHIGFNDGAALRELVRTNGTVKAALGLESAERAFVAADPLAVEKVQVRVRWQHPRQADLRVTLRSPAGTVSVLHRPGYEQQAVLTDWTFSSTRHLGETSVGTWTLAVTDIGAGSTGTLSEAELILHGVPITDTDADGLDDGWEETHFTTLTAGPRADPDADGWNNATEQLRGSDPKLAEESFLLTVTPLGSSVRVSWPGVADANYRLWTAPDAGQPFTLLGDLPGRFPEAGFFVPKGGGGLFRVDRLP